MQVQNTSLYFIALIPPDDITAEITALKHQIAEITNAKKALRIMPHITLKAPFTVSSDRDTEVAQWFENLNITSTPFDVSLNGFGSFDNPKNPVIFIKPVPSAPLLLLQKEILEAFKKQFADIAIHYHEASFHPHMTIAYRDLLYTEYKKAWKIYALRPYSKNFINRNFYLLKHNGIEWKIIKTCSLQHFPES